MGRRSGSRDARAAGSGRIAELLAPVSGFVLDDSTRGRHGVVRGRRRDERASSAARRVVNAGGAEFPKAVIVMGIDDVASRSARPTASPCTWRLDTATSRARGAGCGASSPRTATAEL